MENHVVISQTLQCLPKWYQQFLQQKKKQVKVSTPDLLNESKTYTDTQKPFYMQNISTIMSLYG